MGPCRRLRAASSGLADWPQALPGPRTGENFAPNALLKAEHYHELTGRLALADDSGS